MTLNRAFLHLCNRNALALTALLGAAPLSQAETVDTSVWKSDAELGFVNTQGNTETQNTNAKLSVLNERAAWRHEGQLEGLESSTDNESTAEKYTALAKTNYKLSERNYVFGVVKYVTDRFSGYDYQASESIGYGRRAIKTETVILDLEIGAGARQSETDTGDRSDEGIIRGAGNFSWAASSTSIFTEQLTAEAGSDATITTSVTALKAKVNSSLAMKVSYTIKHTSDVPPDVKKTDTETAVTLVYTLL